MDKLDERKIYKVYITGAEQRDTCDNAPNGKYAGEYEIHETTELLYCLELHSAEFGISPLKDGYASWKSMREKQDITQMLTIMQRNRYINDYYLARKVSNEEFALKLTDPELIRFYNLHMSCGISVIHPMTDFDVMHEGLAPHIIAKLCSSLDFSIDEKWFYKRGDKLVSFNAVESFNSPITVGKVENALHSLGVDKTPERLKEFFKEFTGREWDDKLVCSEQSDDSQDD